MSEEHLLGLPMSVCSTEVAKLWHEPPPGAAVGPLREAQVVCMRDIFILNEIWAQDKIHIVGRLGLNILLIT
jgi:hypothetical protein